MHILKIVKREALQKFCKHDLTIRSIQDFKAQGREFAIVMSGDLWIETVCGDLKGIRREYEMTESKALALRGVLGKIAGVYILSDTYVSPEFCEVKLPKETLKFVSFTSHDAKDLGIN